MAAKHMRAIARTRTAKERESDGLEPFQWDVLNWNAWNEGNLALAIRLLQLYRHARIADSEEVGFEKMRRLAPDFKAVYLQFRNLEKQLESGQQTP